MIGVLCIHGFTGSPKEVEPLVHFLQDHTNWVIRTPTLPGHGHPLRLKGIGFEEWLYHAEKELSKLQKTCEEIYICGFSMGGLIGSWLASRYTVDKLVLLSAAAHYLNPKKYVMNLLEMLIKKYKGKDQADKRLENYKYKFKSTPLSAYLQFLKLVWFVRPAIPNVKVPTFVIQGREDPIVPIKSAEYIYSHICTNDKKILLVDEADHLICHGSNQSQLFSEILFFLEEHSA